ncbi:MAG: hypothetical protein IKL66_05745 [Clostridia bacterium]|nr:hypothetical protein [Clostridia bacterium]
MKKLFKRSICLTLLLALVLCSLTFIGCSSDEKVTENKILSVEVKSNKNKVKLKAGLSEEYVDEHRKEKVYLLAMENAYTGELEDYTVIANARVKDSMTFTFDLNGDNGSMQNSAFVLARVVSGKGEEAVYEAISPAAHITNPEIFSSSSAKATDGGFKGFSTDNVYEAELLGASSVLFEVEMNELILNGYEDGAINYFYGDRSFYFDGAAVAELDKKISDATALGMKVYLRTVLKYPQKTENGSYEKDLVNELYCAGATYGKEGYLPNMSNGNSRYVGAFYSFLANRYGSEGKEYGTAIDHIIGFSVNDYETNCNAGNMSEDEFIAGYYSWAKLADSVLRSYNKNAQVYVSVDNGLQATSSSSDIGIASFLPRFAEISSTSSKWNFAVALNLGNGENVGELLSGSGDIYSHVSANNLASFFEILSNDALMYDSERRVAIVDHLSLPDSVSESNRAAYYSYTYYKIAEAGFDTFLYAANSETGGLYSASGKRADFYYSVLMCGSNIASQLSEYTNKITGAVTPKFNEHKTIDLSFEQNAKTTLSESLLKKERRLSLSASELCAMGGAYDVNVSPLTVEDGLEKQIITVRGDLNDSHVAMTTVGLSASELISSGYIGITMSSSQNSRVALVISREGDERAVYVGEAGLSATPSTYYFDITSFTDSVKSSDELRVSLCAFSAENGGDIEITVEDMMLYGASGNGRDSTTVTIIVCIACVALCGLFVLLTVQRKRKMKERDR